MFAISKGRAGRRMLLLAGIGFACAFQAPAAFGASVFICVPTGTPAAIVGGSSGSCPTRTTPVALPSSSTDQHTLISLLPHISFSPTGIDGKPTVQFTGVNVQVVDGKGATSSVNGTGNLVLGYDESPGTQSGSHDLILGVEQSYSSYGDLVGGYGNDASGADASVLGDGNSASGNYSTVTGGADNVAAGQWASVSGGQGNLAGDSFASIAGGCDNLAGPGTQPNVLCAGQGLESIAGGRLGNATGHYASITGGFQNAATGPYASIAGGQGNLATDYMASILGGCANLAGAGDQPNISCLGNGLESITGGRLNQASGHYASIGGGFENQTTGPYATISGGDSNTASDGSGAGSDKFAWVGGGFNNVADGNAAAILGGTSNTVGSSCGTFPDTGQSC